MFSIRRTLRLATVGAMYRMEGEKLYSIWSNFCIALKIAEMWEEAGIQSKLPVQGVQVKYTLAKGCQSSYQILPFIFHNASTPIPSLHRRPRPRSGIQSRMAGSSTVMALQRMSITLVVRLAITAWRLILSPPPLLPVCAHISKSTIMVLL